MAFFVLELRQAGNDGPLVFFTTLALYAAWRRLHGDGAEVGGGEAGPGPRRWSLLLYAALGLGFLTKGPVIVLLVALTVVPYLATARALRRGLGLLADGWGLLLFTALALSWPVPVLLHDPNAARVWLLEMGQKAGTVGVTHHRPHAVLAAAWPWMTVPWVVVATAAAALPFLPRGRAYRPAVWFPWWWAVGNLAMFCLWSVAKPNYYLPCMPGAALLAGVEWVRLARAAREPSDRTTAARRILQVHWVALFAGALAGPVVARQLAPQFLGWSLAFGPVAAAAVVASAWAWRRGADAGSLAPLAAALVAGFLVLYGAVAPSYNPRYSHRTLAADLEQAVPPGSPIMFFDEVDEGLWFYLRDRTLAAVPGSQPRYNPADTLNEEFRSNRLELDPNKRLAHKTDVLRAWLSRPDRTSPHVLMRHRLYERMAPALGGLLTPVHREQGLSRYEMVLLRVNDPGPVAEHRSTAAHSKY
jgi:4-amino-4-deoxy-L-arabinose transferase-like glycosyltransferase